MGGDEQRHLQRRPGLLFQSTPPHGGRHGDGRRLVHPREVSIHAPAWGATILCCIVAFYDCFNPRPRMGGDFLVCPLRDTQKVSIHAPAWGATPQLAFAYCPSNGFNPRPRMGGDKYMCMDFGGEVFQSTPPHGGRHQS